MTVLELITQIIESVKNHNDISEMEVCVRYAQDETPNPIYDGDIFYDEDNECLLITYDY